MYKGKNTKAMLPEKFTAPSFVSTYTSTAAGKLFTALVNVKSGKQDANTALREAEESMNKTIEADAANQADYEKNYAALKTKIESIDADYTAKLAQTTNKDIVTSHQAFGYLARDYGLKEISIMGLSPDAEPRAQDLLEISKFVKANGVKYIFFEELVSDQLAKTLANEAGIKKALVAPRHREENTAESIEKSLRTTSFLWSKSRSVQEGDAVWKYLNRRIPGIQQIPDDIHYANAQYWETDESGKSHHRGDYDAMVVRGFSPCGKLVQMHTTYLTPEGAKAEVSNVKKIRPGCGFSSFAFRIGAPTNGVLGLCEGIETAIAASLLHGVPVWPCHSASVLENFQVPADMVDAVKRIIIFADNDRSKVGGGIRNTGMLAAQALAKRLRKEGFRVLIMVTGRVGDFNDRYNDLRQAQVTCDTPEAAAPDVSQEPFERKFRNFG